MHIIVIHAETGDTVAIVTRVSKLAEQGLNFTEMFDINQITERDLVDDLEILLNEIKGSQS